MLDDGTSGQKEQTASAPIDTHADRIAGADEAELINHLLDERQDLFQQGIGKRDDAVFELGAKLRGVELLDEVFDKAEIGGLGADDDTARPRLRDDGDARFAPPGVAGAAVVAVALVAVEAAVRREKAD